MQLLPDVARDDAPPEVDEALAVLPDLALFRLTAHASGVFRPWLEMGAALLRNLELDAGLREVAILQLAHDAGSDYEWTQHAAIARAAGLTAEHIEAIERGSIDELDAAQRHVARAAREFTCDGRVAGSTIGRLRDQLGVRATVELLLVLGHYLAIARVVASVQLEADAPDHVIVDTGGTS